MCGILGTRYGTVLPGVLFCPLRYHLQKCKQALNHTFAGRIDNNDFGGGGGDGDIFVFLYAHSRIASLHR
jgi:hypothetical protein